jgi:hypothetical protein
VVHAQCVENGGLSICDHIRKFYKSNVAGDPALFWIFESSDLPQSAVLDPNAFRNEDPCHDNVQNLTKSVCRKMVAAAVVYICANDGIRVATVDDIKEQQAA